MATEHQFDRRTFLKLAGGAAVIAGGGFLAQRFDVFGQAAKRLDKMANPRKIECFLPDGTRIDRVEVAK